jgi:Phytanoyl-CoA dioxygenase (PhyH)
MPITSISVLCEAIEQHGFVILRAAFTVQECNRLAADLESALAACQDEATALRRTNGALYGARNLLDIFPASQTLWRKEPLISLMTTALGSGFGLVRGLYFDKSPESNWSLPWHQDLTIAVQDNSLPTTRFRNPTHKAGVPHVEAPREILEQMLTLRIHLDDVTPDNGPLRILGGSHQKDAPPDKDSEATILAKAGDVLAMRPLLYHCSSSASSLSALHRRIIHLEFAGCQDLPDGYAWRHFIQGH